VLVGKLRGNTLTHKIGHTEGGRTDELEDNGDSFTHILERDVVRAYLIRKPQLLPVKGSVLVTLWPRIDSTVGDKTMKR